MLLFKYDVGVGGMDGQEIRGRGWREIVALSLGGSLSFCFPFSFIINCYNILFSESALEF